MKKLIPFLILFGSCSDYNTTKVGCCVDSVYMMPKISVQDQLTTTWVAHTNCGNVYSLSQNYYKKGDSVYFKVITK